MTISVNRIRDRVEIIHIKKSDQSRNYEQGGKGERRISAGFSNGNGRTFQIQHLLFRPKPRPIGFRCRLCLRFCGKNYQYFFTASNDDKISSRAFFGCAVRFWIDICLRCRIRSVWGTFRVILTGKRRMFQ